MTTKQQTLRPENLVIPPTKGSYILFLRLARKRQIDVGRLGTVTFSKGYYAYTGSACGPGGLAARLRHHLRSKTHLHWHIDYLIQHTTLSEIWLSDDGRNHEHLWAETLQQLKGSSLPAAGFGSTDCRCPSHLIHFSGPVSRRSFIRHSKTKPRTVAIYSGCQKNVPL